MKAKFYKFIDSDTTLLTYFKVKRTRYKLWVGNRWYDGFFTWKRLTDERKEYLYEVPDLEAIIVLGAEALQ